MFAEVMRFNVARPIMAGDMVNGATAAVVWF